MKSNVNLGYTIGSLQKDFYLNIAHIFTEIYSI